MDRGVDLEAYSSAVQAFCEARDWDQFHGPKDLAIGVTTEAAELLQLFRFQNEAQATASLDDPGFRAQVGDELADVLFMLTRFAQRFGFDLLAEASRKLGVNETRYPVSVARGSNRKYVKP